MTNTIDDLKLQVDRMANIAIANYAPMLKFPNLIGRWKTAQGTSNPKKYLVPKIGDMVANEFDERGKVIPQNVTSDNTEIAVKFFEATFQESGFSNTSDVSETTADRLNEAVAAIARKVDSYFLETVVTDADVTLTAGTLGSAATRAFVLAAELALNNNEVPEEDRHLVTSLTGDQDLRADADYKAMGVYNLNSILIDGKLPRLEGFQMHRSPRVYIPSSGQRTGLAFHKNAIWSVFPDYAPKQLPNGKTVITMKEQDGIRIGIAVEQLEGTLGAIQYTAFSIVGVKPVQPKGVVKFLHR